MKPDHPHSPHDCSGIRSTDQLSDGFSHGLKPLKSLDVQQTSTVDDLLREMSRTAFGGRNMGEAADVMYEMFTDPKCKVIMTLSGAMTMAKMSLLVVEMIEQGLVDAIISTGALMSHGLVESAGMSHFKYEHGMNDTELFQAGYCRVYDTLELEKNLDDLGLITKEVLASFEADQPVGSSTICRQFGKYLLENYPGRGILPAAYTNNIPIYIPAFTDSEMGLDVAMYNVVAREKGTKALRFDPFVDMFHYTDLASNAERIGIFTIGGGVPRNWAQQVGPFIDYLQRHETGQAYKPCRFRYGVRICPEPVHWGGLSGCTYSEGISWGKFIPPAEGGRFAEVLSDATIAWPILLRGVLERMGRVKST
ncbi:deoxyhypusine synthase family protein [bacterium]|nr:deoxyhypusine synthase family protein [bacterium]